MLKNGKFGKSIFDNFSFTTNGLKSINPESSEQRWSWWTFLVKCGYESRCDMHKFCYEHLYGDDNDEYDAGDGRTRDNNNDNGITIAEKKKKWRAELEERRKRVEEAEAEDCRVALESERAKKERVKLERKERTEAEDQAFERRMQHLAASAASAVTTTTAKNKKNCTFNYAATTMTSEQLALKRAHENRPKAAISADFDARQQAAHDAAVERKKNARAEAMRRLAADASSHAALMDQAQATQATLASFVLL
jgi:hypothetical protein